MLLQIIMQTFGILLNAVWFVVVGQFVLYLLLAFNVVSIHNKVVSTLWNFLSTILDPLLEPIRRRLPPMNGMDFSYMVLLFGLWIINWILGAIYVATIS
ncbi:MAG: YggT family protein [Sphingomonadales bacterium]|nr:YggT family protein [Sphingomonadales bacterium]